MLVTVVLHVEHQLYCLCGQPLYCSRPHTQYFMNPTPNSLALMEVWIAASKEVRPNPN